MTYYASLLLLCTSCILFASPDPDDIRNQVYSITCGDENHNDIYSANSLFSNDPWWQDLEQSYSNDAKEASEYISPKEATRRLWKAVEFNDDQEVIKLLQEHKANANDTRAGGLTPLILACQKGCKLEIVMDLLYHQADVDATTIMGEAALHFVPFTDIPRLEMLLYNNASPIITNVFGTSPYSKAIASSTHAGMIAAGLMRKYFST